MNFRENYFGRLFLFLTILLSLTSVINVVVAQNIDVSGNAAGSSNKATFESSNSTNINQNNQSNVDNSARVNCNTGGNSTSGISGGGVTTGDCEADVNVSNNFNSNLFNLGDPKVSPSPRIASPFPNGDDNHGNGENNGNGEDDGEDSGNGDGSESDGSAEVLAATGVGASVLLMLGGFGLLFLGLRQFQKALLN